MSMNRSFEEPEEAARLLLEVSQAAHDAAQAEHAADVLLGINKSSAGTYSRGSTRSPSPEHFSGAAPPNNRGTKRRRRALSVLSDHSTSTPTRGAGTSAAGIRPFNPWDTRTHDTVVDMIRRGCFITGPPQEVDPKSKDDKHPKHVEVSIATLRQRGRKIVTKKMAWKRAHPLDENGGPEGKETWELAVKAEQHFREMFPDAMFRKGKKERKAGVKTEEEGMEADEEDEEDGAPGPSQPKRRRLDASTARPAAPPPPKSSSNRKAAATLTSRKGKERATSPDIGRERSPETPYVTPPFSPEEQQPGASSSTPANRNLLPDEPVEDLAARFLDLAGASIERTRRPARPVTFASRSIDEILASAREEGEREEPKARTAKGRVVQKPRKFGE
ncbi:MAG: hypothetical protein Q9184_001585 [Pyrenodesmia sp. 2 TL-2023]